MTVPTPWDAGTGAPDAGGAWTYTCQAPVAAGRIFIVQILQDGTTNGAVTSVVGTNIEDLGGTDNVWTQISGPLTNGTWAVGASEEALQFLFIGRSLSTSAPTISGGNSTSEDLFIRSVQFQDVSDGTTLATVIENGAGDAIIPQDTGTATLDFGKATGNYESAGQTFTATRPISGVSVYLNKNGTPTDDVICEIQTVSGGVPTGTVLATRTIAASAISSGAINRFQTAVDLTQGTSYAIVLRRSGAGSDTNYYSVWQITSNAYGSGDRVTKAVGGSWATSGGTADLRFLIHGLCATSVGSSATAADAAVQRLGPDRFALNFVAVNDDNAISTFTGETGGDWIIPVSNYADAGGTDGAIGVQGSHIYTTGYTGSLDGATDVAGLGGSEEELAQSFSLSADATITRIHLWPNRVGTTTDNLIVEFQTDSGGLPSGTVVGEGASIAISSLPTSTQSILYPTVFRVSAALTSGVTYWIVMRRSGSRDINNKAQIARNQSDSYAGGTRALRNSGTWSTSAGGDVLFSLGENTGTIDGGTGSIVDIDAWGVVGFALIGTTVVLDQTHYRFRNDNGSETTATWKENVDTTTTYDTGSAFRVRFALAGELHNPPSADYELDYSINGSAYQSIGSSAADKPIRIFASSNITNTEATTQQISSGTFTAGQCIDTAVSAFIDYPANVISEIEFSIHLHSGASTPLAANDVVSLRLRDTAGTTAWVYTQTAQFTVAAAATKSLPLPNRNMVAIRR